MTIFDRVYLTYMVAVVTLVIILGVSIYRNLQLPGPGVRHTVVRTQVLKKLQRYHGTIALEILPNGQVSIWRGGKWIVVQKGE